MASPWLERVLFTAILAAPAWSMAADKAMPRRAFPIVCTNVLTDAEVADIHRRAFVLEPQDAEVWFVAVVYVDRFCFHADVYFKPDESSPRLRKGRYAALQSQRNDPTRELRDRDIFTYAQVSPPDRPFGDALEAPQMAHIPFHWPKLAQWEVEKRPRREGEERTPMSGEEVVRLIDAARTGFDYPPTSPVCTIRYEPDEDAVAVACGVSGHGGNAVFLRKQPTGEYKRVGGCGWSGAFY